MAKVSFTRNLYRFFPTLPTAGVEIDANSVAELVNELVSLVRGASELVRRGPTVHGPRQSSSKIVKTSSKLVRRVLSSAGFRLSSSGGS